MNIKKSKVVIFAKGRQAHYSFVLDDQTLDIENEYKYLGVLFSRSGSFFAAKKLLVGQAEKAIYGLIRKSRSLMLPIDLQIELFERKWCSQSSSTVVRYGVSETLTCWNG